MRKIIQIKGANATGKTTIARQLIGLSSNVEEIIKPRVTVLHDLNIALMGHYSKDYMTGGGCENTTLRPIENLKLELELATKQYNNNYDILFEGMMISLSMTMYNFMKELQKDYAINPIVVLLISSIQGCLTRLDSRSKELKKPYNPINMDYLQDKINRISTWDYKYDIKDIRHIQVDNIPKEDMIFEFLSVIGWKPNG